MPGGASLGGRREPFADGASGGKNVLERCEGLGVAAGLQTAVGVDPELACGDRRERRVQEPGDFGDAWHARRVDVVDARSDAVVEAACPNVCDDVHPRSGGLDTCDVGIQVADRIDDDAELRVAQVCVCLLYTSPSPRDGLLSRMPS